jgi:RNA polymerase sigma-70 factor, ECF subfamily
MDALYTSDFALAQKADQGNMQAFAELYKRHHRRVLSLCLRMTRNLAEAEDLAQDVFLHLLKKVGSFRGEAAFTSWLHRLTVNHVLMHFQKLRVRLEQTTEDGEMPTPVTPGTDDPRTMSVLIRLALQKAIDKLPAGYRLVFQLHDIEGHEHEEIARRLGCTVGTSKSQLHKARRTLRRLLGQLAPKARSSKPI